MNHGNRTARVILPALLLLSPVLRLAPAAAQEAHNYRVFIQSGDFTLTRNGEPCKFIDLTRIPVSSFVVNASFPEFETTFVPEEDLNECGFFLRPKLEMKGHWYPQVILPPPGGEPLNAFIAVDFRMVLQIRECPEDGCDWFDTEASFVVRTDELTEAGTDLPEMGGTFTRDDDVHGFFEGDMHLKVATERLDP